MRPGSSAPFWAVFLDSRVPLASAACVAESFATFARWIVFHRVRSPKLEPRCFSFDATARLSSVVKMSVNRGGQVWVFLLRGLVVQLPLNGVLHELAASAQGEFFLQVCLVRFDGLHTQMERLGDLTRAETFADHSEHLEFTV